MRGLPLLILLFVSNILSGQNNRTTTLTCNNWLSNTAVGSGVKIGDLDVSGTNITVEAVFNRNVPYSGNFLYAGNIVSKHLDPSSTNYLLRPNSAEITTSNGYFVTSGPCTISLNKTYHVAMVYNGSTLKFYRNGFLMSQVNATGTLFQNNFITTIAEHATGATSPAETMLGYINEVRIWNVARSQTEIRASMDGSLPNPTSQAGLLAYYTFDNLLNKQGNPAWNGTLVGTATINATNPNCTFVADSCAIPVVTASFATPDTVCINSPVNITNNSIGGTSYYWNFCAADLNQTPTATNLGNVNGTFSLPAFSDFAQYNGNYYVFVANNSPGSVTRLDFGTSLLNTPTAVNLGNFGGVLTNNLEGVQIVYNGGRWYGILVGGYPAGGTPSKIMKLDFGPALTNTAPIASDWGNIGNLSYPIDLHLFQEGNNWYGLTTNSTNNTITRFNFGTSFNNIPTGVNLGNPGNLLQGPTGIYAINDNGVWRVFIADAQPGNKVVRLDFGNSLLNTPTAVSLGSPNNIFNGPRDITILNYCGRSIGFVVNGATTNNELIRLNFNNGLQNTFTASNLGNIGNFNFPHSISKLFRVGPDLYSFITNASNNSITRLRFAGCTNSSIPNSALQTPPPVTYTVPGIYNINLSVDDGLATQNAYCKQVVVLAKPLVSTRADTSICPGGSVQLTTTASGTTTYSWSPATGLSNSAIASPIASPSVTTTYIVTANNGFCQSTDTVIVNVNTNCIITQAGFTTPDTVCVNTPVNISNTSTGASTYYWNFCTANLNQSPTGVNLGNPGGTFSFPVFSDYTFYNGSYYAFVTNNLSGTLTRLDFGNSLLNTPTAVNLGNFGGVLSGNLESIQIVFNENRWYALMVGGDPSSNNPSKIVKLDFGTALTNTPTATNWGNIGGLNYPIDLHVFKENTNWYGLTTNSRSGTITRFNFGTSFNNIPLGINLGNPGNLLSSPTGVYAINDNGFWRIFVTNDQPTSTVIRLDFGSSLLNTPNAVNLGNPGGVLNGPRDITIINYCGKSTGFVVNGAANQIVRLNFNNGLQNSFVATSLGNIGGLSFPHSISKLFREGADLYSFITNVSNNSITRLRFQGCTNSSVPNSALQNPAPVTYNIPGIYNINLNVDDGLATQNAFCKQITVLAKPTIVTRADTSICPGGSIQLNSFSSGATSYSWSPSTGLSSNNVASPIASPPTTTTYIVTVSNGYCQSSDTVVISVNTTCNNISDVINSYTPVLALLPCENKLTVEDASSFNIGDTVLLIQMKGAIIDSTNSSTFGTVTDYSNSGNYEFNYVQSKANNIIELKNTITKQYTLPDGKVQLVRVPYFSSTSVSSTLTCLPWDGRKGGVLVFNVRDTLTLNADIDVSGKGFRGGLAKNSNINTFTCGINNYYYPINTVNAAGKGESIYDLDSLRNAGRGAKASGGGGGMNPNTGGGGGSNGGVGGRGGYGYGDCPNYLTDQNWGLGGYNLAYNNTQNKIYLGGGGGAGHCNNGFENLSVNTNFDGGNGGGIVIINSRAINGNNKNILSKGAIPYELTGPGFIAHDGMGGGGAGGTVLINADTYLSGVIANISGARGGNMSSSTTGGRVGPGGGGSGGVMWIKQTSIPNLLGNIAPGGTNGVILQDGNNAYGATSGTSGIVLTSLKLSIDTTLFVKNIDSTRINDSITSCSSFYFKGRAFTRVVAISNWEWTFGDGSSANTQNVTHTYQTTGNYQVKLIVTDANGCKDSISKSVFVNGANISDFSFRLNPCNPLSVQFVGSVGNTSLGNYWSFGDGTSLSGNLNPSHSFPGYGSYTIRYTNPIGNCNDTVTKIISLGVQYQNLIITQDTTVCYGTSKQLRTDSTNLFCWSPSIYLNNTLLANNYTTPLQPITYYFTSLVAGNNLLINSNFSGGNIGFNSSYNYSNSSTGSGQYYVGPNAGSWLGSTIICNIDHTTGTGNMLMVNGSSTANSKIWSQIVSVNPNTNYEISGWTASLNSSSSSLQISIDGLKQDTAIIIGGNPCNWKRFATTWNSGSKSSVEVSLIKISTGTQADGFALDDLSFAPISVKFDSIHINIDRPIVQAFGDTSICRNDTTHLQAIGASSFTWSPSISLLNANSNNPSAFPTVTTQYIVSGTNISGCMAKDTVIVQVKPLPVITALTNDTTICRNSSLQLNANGGVSYSWLPAVTLSNSSIPNPIATPSTTTTYYVNVTGANNCTVKDSVFVTLKSPPLFMVGQVAPACVGAAIQLSASGGNEYLWSPALGLSSTIVANPIAVAASNIQYSVKIKETVCRDSTILVVPVNVLPLPNVQAYRSNDIDCNIGVAALSATGARSYRWTPGRSLSDSSTASPLATPIVTTIYNVVGVADNGCLNTDTVIVTVKYEGNGMHYMPNAFTPNSDGLNDCFGIKNWGTVTNLRFLIYNRWGQQVFSTTNPSACWDGKFNSVSQQSGNFIYIIKAKTSCGEVDMKGSVLLIR